MASAFEPGTVLLVSSTAAKNLDFFDLSSGEKLATINDLHAEPHEITFDPSRRRAYITHTYRAGAYGGDVPKAHEISVIDVDERRVETVIDTAPYFAPHDIEYDPVLDLIITGVEDVDGRQGILLISGATGEVEANIETTARNCHWLALVPGRKLYIAHKEAPILTVIDLVNRRVEDTISVPGGAEEIDASPEGDFVYAVIPLMPAEFDPGSGRLFRPKPQDGDPVPRVVKIDVESNKIVDEIELDNHYMGLRAGHEHRVYVTSMNNQQRPEDPDVDLKSLPRNVGKLAIIDSSDMSLVGSVDVGPIPLTVRSSQDNSTVWVANLGSGLVTVIDGNTQEHLGDLNNNAGGFFGGTHGMALIPPK